MTTKSTVPECAPSTADLSGLGFKRRYKWRLRLRRQVQTVLGADAQATIGDWQRVNAHRSKYGSAAVPYAEFLRALAAPPPERANGRERERRSVPVKSRAVVQRRPEAETTPLALADALDPQTAEGQLQAVFDARGLDPRQQHVLWQRLKGRSLDAIGQDREIRRLGRTEAYTRENVRVIEQLALAKLGVTLKSISDVLGEGQAAQARELADRGRGGRVSRRDLTSTVHCFVRRKPDPVRAREQAYDAELGAAIKLVASGELEAVEAFARVEALCTTCLEGGRS